jgi:serine/threonine-protein kinase
VNPPNQLSAALAGRYEIEREIGAGGMATVYLARDVRHARRVALKVLKPELGAVLGVERFLAEIQVTANLQHPNLLPLFDSGEANGLLFYVMPFVEGESLRARLDREKQLPVDEAVRIAVAIAGALDYAHKQGVIHRDLKPENVLLQAGQPVIADFGIALAVSKAGGTRVTQTGLSLGTPQYMSPEQATGDRGIDARTDIYSLSAMTYEMLTGEPPHTGTSAQAIIAKLMTEEVRPLTTLRHTVPAHIDAAVRHGLEKLAADRFATAGEFSLALTGAKPWVESVPARHGALAAASRLDRRNKVAVSALALVAVGGVGTAAWLAKRSETPPVAARFELRLPDSVELFEGGGTKLAISNDGRAIAIVGTKNGRKAIYLRRIDEPAAQLIRGTEGGTDRLNVSPRFSPDGQWLLYTAARELRRIRVTGGQTQTLADSGGSSDWGEGDRVLYVHNSELWLGTAEGHDGRRVASPDTARGVFRLVWPRILPGGDRALVVLDRSPAVLVVDSLRLDLVSLKTGEVIDLGVAGTTRAMSAAGTSLGRSGASCRSALLAAQGCHHGRAGSSSTAYGKAPVAPQDLSCLITEPRLPQWRQFFNSRSVA